MIIPILILLLWIGGIVMIGYGSYGIDIERKANKDVTGQNIAITVVGCLAFILSIILSKVFGNLE